MSDLINRQDAIDEISKYASVWMEYDAGMTQEEVAEAALKAAKRTMVHILEEMPSVQSWIPCSERMPDNYESVLISHSHGVTKAWWNGRFWTSIAVKKYKTVTAWMPLPEPYQEGGQNE